MKFKETYQAIKRKPFLLAIPVLFDLLAMIIFGYTLLDIRDRALIIIIDMQDLLQRSSNFTMQIINETNIVEMFSHQADLAVIESALIKLLFMLILVFWLVWLFFQGGSWKFASFISGKKTGFFRYLGRFVLVNIFWLSLLTFINVFLVNHQFNLQINFHKTFIDFITIIIMILNAIIIYFMFISYGLMSRFNLKHIFKNTFRIGIKKPLNVLFTYLFIAIGFAVIDLLLRLFVLINSTTAFIVGVFLLLPYLIIARVFLIKNVENL